MEAVCPERWSAELARDLLDPRSNLGQSTCSRALPAAGDALLFDGGGHDNEVLPGKGVRRRWTLGSFYTRSRDGSWVHLWG